MDITQYAIGYILGLLSCYISNKIDEKLAQEAEKAKNHEN
jgi:ABC-type dipeptide/oligopeptide/nickel transport system permease subunit